MLGEFALTIPFAVYFRIRSQASREPLDRRQEGLFILIALRLCGLMAWLGVMAYMIRPSSMAWASIPMPASARWMGAALGLPATGLLLWTFRTLGRNLTDTVVTRKEHTLVISGPYRWVRHPFYDSAALLVVAATLMMRSWFVLALGVAVLSLLVTRTKKEEANLIARFGADYTRYMASTGRFIPNFLR